MIIWEKVLQVKEKKIKQHLIRPVEDVGGILIIEGRDSVLIVDLVELQNFDNQPGGIGIERSMAIKVFTANLYFT